MEMNRNDKKAAAAAYKQRKAVAGIYALRCALTGQRWVGRALDLDTIQSRLWFTLRQGATPHRSLLDAWKAHGADSFTFEELERLDEEELGYARDAALKDRLAHWRTELNAAVI
jgi:hypothetical protein